MISGTTSMSVLATIFILLNQILNQILIVHSTTTTIDTLLLAAVRCTTEEELSLKRSVELHRRVTLHYSIITISTHHC